MFKIILVVVGCAVLIALGIWAFAGDKVDEHMLERGNVENWSAEIPLEVPLYLSDHIISSEVNSGEYRVTANSNTKHTDDYYEKLISEGWRVLTPLDLNEDVTSSNTARLRKGNLTVDLRLGHGVLYITVNEH